MKYTIHDQGEETYCDWCGRPLYAGDSAFESANEDAVFCSMQDKRAYERAEREADTGYRAFEYVV